MQDRRELQDIELGFSPWPLAFSMAAFILLLLCSLAGGMAAFAYGLYEGWILVALLIPIGLLSGGACIYLVWRLANGLPDVVRRRVRACSDGVELDSTGQTRWRWAQIDRFEVGSIEFDDEGSSSAGAVVFLRDGQRLDLPALRRSSLNGRSQRHVVQIRERVATLNQLLDQANKTAHGARP